MLQYIDPARIFLLQTVPFEAKICARGRVFVGRWGYNAPEGARMHIKRRSRTILLLN